MRPALRPRPRARVGRRGPAALRAACIGLALVERGDQGGWHGRRATLGTSGFLRDFDEHLWLAAAVAQQAVDRVRPGGTLLFMGGTGAVRGSGFVADRSGQAYAIPASRHCCQALSRTLRTRWSPVRRPGAQLLRPSPLRHRPGHVSGNVTRPGDTQRVVARDYNDERAPFYDDGRGGAGAACHGHRRLAVTSRTNSVGIGRLSDRRFGRRRCAGSLR